LPHARALAACRPRVPIAPKKPLYKGFLAFRRASIRRAGKRLQAWNRAVYYIVKRARFGGIAVADLLHLTGVGGGIEPSDDRAARCHAAPGKLGSPSMQPNVFVRDRARTHAYDGLFTSIRSVSKHD